MSSSSSPSLSCPQAGCRQPWCWRQCWGSTLSWSQSASVTPSSSRPASPRPGSTPVWSASSSSPSASALLPHWAGTKHYSREVASWAVETFSFLLQALVVASLVWGVGLDNISQRISSAGQGELGRFYKFYATLGPLALLLVTAFIAVQDIDKRDLTVGCSVFLVMTVSLFLSSAVLVIDKVRRGKQKHLAWRQIWLEEILGRRSEEVRDNSLTNSYRKFERCDLTSASIMKIKTNHWQYRNKDGIF